ncbi:MAG: DNA-processing protein DprA [Desulfotomaculaceae bacterium]|nr:DNA-processing protein DprA [Desulfotomaculaceae bacterium]
MSYFERSTTSTSDRSYIDFNNKYLARQGIPLISGMAKGIDGYGQTACLQAGGYTLAFLAHGRQVLAVPNSIYSPESTGTNRLILHGALPYLGPEQLLVEETTAADPLQAPESLQKTVATSPAPDQSPLQLKIMQLLCIAPCQVEELAPTHRSKRLE